MRTISYSVPDISCGHCRTAITSGVSTVAGVEAVEVDLDAKTVTVTGSTLDELKQERDKLNGLIGDRAEQIVHARGNQREAPRGGQRSRSPRCSPSRRSLSVR